MHVDSFTFEAEPREAFIDLPFAVYAEDPRWIPPVRAEQRFTLCELNPFFQHGDVRCFLARRDEGDRDDDGEEASYERPGRLLARAAAIANHDLRHEGEPVGLVGYFEAHDDPGAARAVLDAACAWLRERGFKTAWGPVNFSIYHQYRLMTKGFDATPFLGEPYNPPYYPTLFERSGFEPLARYKSWDLTEGHLRGMRAAADRFGDPALLEEGYRARPIDFDRFDDDIRALYDLVVEGFADNLGATPLGFVEFAAIFTGMRSLVIPDLVPLIYDPAGRLVAFAYLYPDYAPALRGTSGEDDALEALAAARHKGIPERLVFHTMVVRKEARGRRVVETFLGPLLDRALDLGFRQAIGALAKAGPTIYDKTGPASREYTLYQRAL